MEIRLESEVEEHPLVLKTDRIDQFIRVYLGKGEQKQFIAQIDLKDNTILHYKNGALEFKDKVVGCS